MCLYANVIPRVRNDVRAPKGRQFWGFSKWKNLERDFEVEKKAFFQSDEFILSPWPETKDSKTAVILRVVTHRQYGTKNPYVFTCHLFCPHT
jgi:hypothetical protein